MRKGWTISIAASALLPLNGCVLPPVVTLASYSVDLVTYEATGKTATDHIYSAVARSDCSFVRVLRQKPICVDPQPTGIAVGAKTPKNIDTKPRPVLSRFGSASTAQTKNQKIIIGSFLDPTNAERAVARYANWHPQIANVTVGGLAFHRVTARSLTHSEAKALQERIATDVHINPHG